MPTIHLEDALITITSLQCLFTISDGMLDAAQTTSRQQFSSTA
jgi:hypothetical protein